MLQRPNLYDYVKIIALISMIVDHVGYFLFPEQIVWRIVGRLAFPLFLFLVGYNLSRKRKRSLWGAGIGIQLLIFLAYRQGMVDIRMLNILLAIGITRVVLLYASKLPRWSQRGLFVGMAILAPRTLDFIDYGTLSIAFGFLGYWIRTSSHRGYKLLPFLLVAYHLFVMTLTRSFPSETYGRLGLVGITIMSIFLALAQKNYTLMTRTVVDRFILFVSKQALLLYIIQGAILFLLAQVL